MTLRLMILAAALAVVARARVALLPGWVVPVPVVFLAVALSGTVTLAALLVLRFRGTPAPAAAGPAARRVTTGEVTR